MNIKRKLLFSAALAALLVTVTGGMVEAKSITLLQNGSSSVHIDIPGGTPLDHLPNPQSILPACANGADDDGNGLVDMADPGCSSPLDGSESGGATTTPTVPTPTPTPGGPTGPTGPTGPGGKGGGKKGGGKGGHAFGNGGVGPSAPEQERNHISHPPIRSSGGTPTTANPTLSVASFGPAPIGVPNFMIDQFQIPPFLLPIYQACGTEYGVPWEVLASINKIETAFGTNLNVSSAGAVGWMQFIPSTWEAYGVDANNDGRKDPYNPVDAICAAARYLRAAGGDKDLRTAIFAYNHATWYVDEVLLYARSYGKLPADLVGSLTGLTEGAHFPVAANARYADDLTERQAQALAKPNTAANGNVAKVISATPGRRGINIYSRDGAPVVAVNDGVIKDVGHSKELGNYIVLLDGYGNRYTYSQLGSVAKVYAAPKERQPDQLSAQDFKLVTGKSDKAPKPGQTASGSGRSDVVVKVGGSNDGESRTGGATPAAQPSVAKPKPGPINTENLRQRLFANPKRPNNVGRSDLGGQLDALLNKRVPGYTTFRDYFGGVFKFDNKTMDLKPLVRGATVTGGTVLGRIGHTDPTAAPHVYFEIRPAGKGAPTIDPKPILDGWKLLEATAIYRAAGKNPFTSQASVGQVLLMSKEQLITRVLKDPRVSIYSCGRNDIQTGQIDRRVLATMEYLVARGYRLTITSLKCGHSFLSASGNVSEHSTGDAMDIAQVNGIPILGNQGKGSITEAVIKDLLQLQGPMQPHQVISLMNMGGPSFALSDHADHIHVGFRPVGAAGKLGQQVAALLKPDQWRRLIARISQIPNPKVPVGPSKYSLPAGKGKASDVHVGE